MIYANCSNMKVSEEGGGRGMTMGHTRKEFVKD
jgi:hypothetical protein